MPMADSLDQDHLISECFAGLWRYFHARVESDVEDLIQQTFVRYFEATRSAGPIRHPRAYMLRIARSVLFAHYRRRATFDPISDTLPELGPGLSSAFARRQRQDRLRAALTQLPYAQFEILDLYYGEGMRGPVLSAALGLPQGTVRSRLRRAKQRLQAELEDLEGEQTRMAARDRNGD